MRIFQEAVSHLNLHVTELEDIVQDSAPHDIIFFRAGQGDRFINIGRTDLTDLTGHTELDLRLRLAGRWLLGQLIPQVERHIARAGLLGGGVVPLELSPHLLLPWSPLLGTLVEEGQLLLQVEHTLRYGPACEVGGGERDHHLNSSLVLERFLLHKGNRDSSWLTVTESEEESSRQCAVVDENPLDLLSGDEAHDEAV